RHDQDGEARDRGRSRRTDQGGKRLRAAGTARRLAPVRLLDVDPGQLAGPRGPAGEAADDRGGRPRGVGMTGVLSGADVTLGEAAPEEVVRATMLRLANGLAKGVTAARPEVAELVVGALNNGSAPSVRMLGSLGQADLPAMADLSHGLLGEFELQAGEALAL